MNKIKIAALIAAMGMGLAACDEYTLPNPPAQTNPDGNLPVFNAADLTVTSALEAGKLDLNTADAELLKVGSFSVSTLPEGYSFAAAYVMAADAKNAKSDTIAAEISGNDIMVPKQEVDEAIVALFGKNPSNKDIYTEILAYAVNGTSRVRLGNGTMDFAKKEVVVTPVQPSHYIENEYYLVGNFCNWDVTKGIKFTKKAEGDVYDHPDFMVAFTIPGDLAWGDGYQWKIVPASAVAAGNWTGAWGAEPSADDVLAGTLVAAPEAKTKAGVIKQEGPFQINVNMSTLEYKVSAAYPELWVFGPGTSQSNADKALPLTTDNFINYEGTVRLLRQFFLTIERNSQSTAFRNDGETATNPETGLFSGKMKIDPESTESMKVPLTTGQLCYIKANVVTLEWSAMPIKVINIIGGFNGWDVKTAPALTPNKATTVWTINDIELEGEFKFCVDNAWTYSFGGSMDKIVQNGGNLNVEKGTYDVELHFDAYPNYVKLTKK